LVRNGIHEDLLMAAKDEVNFSPKAIPGHEPRAHPIIIYAACSPHHGGTIRRRASADMGHGIGGAIAIGDKSAYIKGGSIGQIRGECQVCPTTAHLSLRAGRATRRIIEDDNPNRIGGLGIKTTEMKGSLDLIEGAVESCGARDGLCWVRAENMKLAGLKGFLGLGIRASHQEAQGHEDEAE